MFVIPRFTYHALGLDSHGIITVLWYLQIFLHPTNQGLTRVRHWNNLVSGTSDDLWPLVQPLEPPHRPPSRGHPATCGLCCCNTPIVEIRCHTGSRRRILGEATIHKYTHCWRFLCSSTSAQNCQCSTLPGVFFRYRIYIFPREEVSLSCLRVTQGITPTHTTSLYRSYVK
jgi:hypothetical protein